jgi:hypothetical protein
MRRNTMQKMTSSRARAVMAGAVLAVLLGSAMAQAPAAGVEVDLATGRTSGAKLFAPAEASYRAVVVAGHAVNVERDGRALRLAVRPPDATAFSVRLPDEVVQLSQVRVTGDKLLVLGYMNGSLATEVLLLDRRSGATLDRFWAYDATPSPDGRYVAFQRFYPSHFVEAWESKVRVYDTSAAPVANRPVLRASQAGDPGRDALVDVGAAIYPVAAEEVERDPTDVAPQELHQLASPLTWSPDGKRLAFVDVQGRVARLVTSDVLPDGGTGRSTRVAPLPELGAVCGAEAPSGCTPLSPSRVVLVVQSQDTRVKVLPERQGGRSSEWTVTARRGIPQ